MSIDLREICCSVATSVKNTIFFCHWRLVSVDIFTKWRQSVKNMRESTNCQIQIGSDTFGIYLVWVPFGKESLFKWLRKLSSFEESLTNWPLHLDSSLKFLWEIHGLGWGLAQPMS